MAELNWGLLQLGNPYKDVQDGYAAGLQDRQRRETTDALNLYATDPQQAMSALLRSGNIEAASGLGKIEAQKATSRREARAAQLAEEKAAREAVIAQDKAKREASTYRDGLLSSVLAPLSQGNPSAEDIAAYWQAAKPRLLSTGAFTADELGQIELSQPLIRAAVAQGLGTAGVYSQANSDRDFEQRGRKQAWDMKHGDWMAGIAGRNAATAAYSAQTGRMSYEARKAAGGFGTPGVGGFSSPDLPSDARIDP